MKAISMSAVEVLPALLNGTKTQTIRAVVPIQESADLIRRWSSD